MSNLYKSIIPETVPAFSTSWLLITGASFYQFEVKFYSGRRPYFQAAVKRAVGWGFIADVANCFIEISPLSLFLADILGFFWLDFFILMLFADVLVQSPLKAAFCFNKQIRVEFSRVFKIFWTRHNSSHAYC